MTGSLLKRTFTLFFIVFLHLAGFSQDVTSFTDNKYLEDQIYVSVVYQKLLDLPKKVAETGFSYGLAAGFIKDLPVNKRRNIGFGAGLGYNLNVHYFNVKLFEGEAAKELKSNKIMLHMVELPIQFRFRTSTPEKFKFWRIYPGFQFSYAFAQSNALKQSEDFDVNKVIKVNNLQYGVTLSAGYNKWNLYAYYGLTEFFNEREDINFIIAPHELRLGLIFYIL